MVKVNASGGEQWNRTFGGADYDYGYFVQRTLDNGYVVAGLTSAYSTSSNHGWLVKFNENGDKLWNMSFGGAKTDQIYSVQQTLDGGYILGGSTQSYAVGGTDVWLIKVSNDTDMSTPTPVLTTILTSPTSATLNTTETQNFTATALDQNNMPMSGINISWTVSNSTVGSIDTPYRMTDINGNVSTTFTALDAGTANVTAANETVFGWQTVTVTKPISPPTNHPPEQPSGLNQFKPDGTTPIATGDTVNTRTVVFKGTINDIDGDKVKLQIELRRTDEYGGNFDENQGGLKNSSLVTSGSEVSISVSDLIDGNYHWRVRTIDEHDRASMWMDFGNNPTLDADFIVLTNQNPVSAEIETDRKMYDGRIVVEKGKTINFDASKSYDADGDVLSYQWDFGDGNSDVGVNVAHSYSKMGEYNVKLTVTDAKGFSNTKTKNIYVVEQVVEGLVLLSDYADKPWTFDFNTIIENEIAATVYHFANSYKSVYINFTTYPKVITISSRNIYQGDGWKGRVIEDTRSNYLQNNVLNTNFVRSNLEASCYRTYI